MAQNADTTTMNVARQQYRTTIPRARLRNVDTMYRQPGEVRLARFLGWFSIGLGVAELVAPRFIGRIAGSRRKHNALIRFYGMREIGAGIGILSQPFEAGWVWSRVAGDALDLASLGATLAAPRSERGKTVASIAAVAGVTALDVICAQRLSRDEGPAGGPERAETSLMVNRSPEECYRFWRDFENLPRFMNYIQSVRVTGDKTSHWVAKMPSDAARVEWDAELVEDVPNERIDWRSLPGGTVFHRGSVEFEPAPGNRGTIIRVQMDYCHPAHDILSPLATLLGKRPEQIANKDLRRFKQVIETGEAITTEGQPAGRRSGATWLDSLAR